MSAYILDTHACVFALGAPKKLGKRAAAVLRRIGTSKDIVWVPAAVVAEIVLLRDLGRTHIGLPELKLAFLDTPSLRFLPLELRQLDEYSALGAIRDPFDRLILAAARSIGAKLITKDAVLTEAGLAEIVWD